MSESETTDAETDIDAEELDLEDADSGMMEKFIRNKMPPGFSSLMSTLQSDNGLAKVMLRPVYVPDAEGNAQVSQAEVIADMFNILRLDSKALGAAADVDISVSRMTPEKAAILLQGAIKGENLDLIEEFAREEERREQILLALTDEETVQAHQDAKQQASHFFQAAGQEVDADE